MATFKEFLEAFEQVEQAVGTKGPFPVDIPWPTDDEIGDYALRVALEWAAPEAGVLHMLALGARIAGFIEKARDRYTEGDLQMLRGIHGSQAGGGKGTKLKVPEDDRSSLNVALVREYNGFVDQQTKIKNDLAQDKISKKAS